METLSEVFPLLKLPYLCMNTILENSEFHAIVHFSFLSKKCHGLVKSVNTQIIGFDVRVSKNGTILLSKKIEIVEECWYLNWNEEGKDSDDIRNIGGCEMGISLNNEKSAICSWSNENVEISTKAVTDYLTDLLKVSLKSIMLEPDDIPNLQYPYLIGFKNWETVHIKGEKIVENEKMKWILDNFKYPQRLTIFTQFNSDFEYDIGDIETESILIRFAQWVTKDMWFRLKCSQIRLFETNYTTEDCKEFVRRWYESDDKVFRALNMFSEDAQFEDGFDFEEIALKRWDKKERSQFYVHLPMSAIDCQNGWDFVRNDGLLATIMFVNDNFVFLVWHERFHDVTDVTFFS